MMQYPAKIFSSEYKLVGDIVRKYPEMSEVMERYFGQNCLKRPRFKIQTLEMACILFGVDQKRFRQEFEKNQN